jgi:hypothetical protein
MEALILLEAILGFDPSILLTQWNLRGADKAVLNREIEIKSKQIPLLIFSHIAD